MTTSERIRSGGWRQDLSFGVNGIGNSHYVIAVVASSSCISPMMS